MTRRHCRTRQEQFQEKWEPVSRPELRQNKELINRRADFRPGVDRCCQRIPLLIPWRSRPNLLGLASTRQHRRANAADVAVLPVALARHTDRADDLVAGF
jgi:hypothetical protein